MFCLLVVLVEISVLAKWLARKTPLRKPNRGEGIVSRKPRPKSGHDFLGLLYCFIVLLCICVVSWPYVIYYPTVMARYSLYLLKVPLNPKQTNTPTNIMCWQRCETLLNHSLFNPIVWFSSGFVHHSVIQIVKSSLQCATEIINLIDDWLISQIIRRIFDSVSFLIHQSLCSCFVSFVCCLFCFFLSFCPLIFWLLCVWLSVSEELSLHFNGHFPGGPGLIGTRMFTTFWILLEIRVMEVILTTGAIRDTKLQSKWHHQQTIIQFFYKPVALPVAQPTVSKHRREKCLYNWLTEKDSCLKWSAKRDVKLYCISHSRPPPLSVWLHLLWCWSSEKEGRAVEVVPGIYAVHWMFSMCTATRTSSYSPVGPNVFFFYIFSLDLCFACLFVLFDLFVSPFFCVSLGSWVISLTVLGSSITNLNEPPRALATSTIV